MEELKEDCVGYCSGIDEDYEFDAPQFYNFTRGEFDSDVQELERWFEVSGDYPPSPFILALNEKFHPVEGAANSSEAKCSNNRAKSTSSTSSNTGRSNRLSTSKKDAKGLSSGKIQPTQDNAKPKADDKLLQAKSSSFMKPTVSHLAKQKKVLDNNSSNFSKRSSFHFK
ncbi:uncharacterized protein LOC127259982 [Andrographis paniculata]|uniref:uncharacterized protein LOC127259982 n=1 Tax=Andrographis paniculata TaxID=175694 RepID=UPI0021E8C0FA|nr:uncharacterized protein LOC127259982 [Andrographis paniculata]